MLVLACKIEIFGKGNKKIRYSYVQSIEIVTSIKNLTDTAKVVFPRRVDMVGNRLQDFIGRGNRISIEIGYAGIDNSVFVFDGYITGVTSATPITIEVENEMWKLKQIKVLPRRYEKFRLGDFLAEYCPDVELVMPDGIEFGEVIINDETTVAKALDYLKQNYPFNAFFDGKKMVAVLLTSYFKNPKKVKFKQGLNIISDTLKYTLAEDVKIQIVAKSILPDNKKLESKRGDEGGEVRTFYAPQHKTQKDLDDFAQNTLDGFKVNNMSGDFTAFGIPSVVKGNTVVLFDSDNKERDNKHFVVDGVKYIFGLSGYRQIVTLGNEIKAE